MTLQRMLCKIMGYDKYVKEKDLLIADALSRSQTTTNHNRSKMNKRFKRPDWFTKIKAYNKPLSRNFRSN